MKEVARIHGVPKVIISNKYPNFTSTFGRVCLRAWREI
jgi:hypothetical protein